MANLSGLPIADGQLPATKTTLYTHSSSNKAHFTRGKFFNTAVAVQTIVIYVNKTGTSRIVGRAVLSQYESYDWVGDEVLDNGDLIEGQSTNATSVDYTLNGVQES